MASFLFAPTPNEEAIDFIKSKPALSRQAFDKLLPELKALSFTISGVQAADVLQRARDLVATLPAGGDWKEIKKGLVHEISPYFVDETADEETRAKQLQAANRRAELLIRTHGQQAYAAAQYAMLDEQRELFPFWQYLTLGDNHVRDTHAALDGVVIPANHEFWQTHFPPWEWGCRCQCVPLTEGDVAAMKAADKDKPKDAQRVLDETQQKEISYPTRRLVRNGVSHYLPAPREQGKPGAFTFHPGDLRMDLASLKARYDEQTWADFSRWAKKTKISDQGATVWSWIGGGSSEWPDLDELAVVKSLGGSTGAELVKDSEGRLFVRKHGKNAAHLREEALADQLYTKLGVPVPKSQLFETKTGPVKLAQFIEGKTLQEFLASASPAKKKAALAAAAEHFGADALLGNWDVGGLNLDNLLVDAQGKVWRIDNGGALRFRAQGAPKGEAWNQFPTELWTLRDAAKNAASAKLFAGQDIFTIARQIDQLDPAALALAPADLRATLEARLGHMRDVARKALDMEHDQWTAGYTDDLTRHMMGMRASGVFDTLSRELTQKAGTVAVVDENGLAWDHLRAHKSGAAATADPFHQPILAAVKSLNNHGAKGDFQFNKTTVDAALSQKAALEKLAKSTKAADQEKAKHYLATIGEIERAMDAAKQKTFHQIPTFTAHMTAPTSPAQRSVVEAFADYCNANGLSNAPASDWMSAQGGSSWNADARAYKFFLSQHLQVPDDEIYWGSAGKNGCKKDWEKFAAKHGAKTDQSLIARHALVQEVLSRVEFRYNDTARRALRLSRTENAAVMKAQKIQPGDGRKMLRGVNESSSIFRKVTVHGSEQTFQAVPHSRVTGLYLLERDPGLANCSFLGDSENEITFVSAGIPFEYNNSGVTFAGGSDAAKWGLDLFHLRTTTTNTP